MIYIYIPVIIVCLILSALCSAADFVYGAVDQTRLEKEAEKGNKRAKIALKISKDYEFSISTILLGNNIVNIVASSFMALTSIFWINSSGKDFGQSVICSIILTVVIIIFCEFLPKAIAKRRTYKLSLRFAYFVSILKYSPTIIIVYPIGLLLKLFSKLFKKAAKKEDIINEEVLNEMVDTIEEDGAIEETEADIIKGAISLTDIQAFEIMTPRVDVYSIDIEDDIESIMQEKEFYGHSRIPVYKDTIDNIVGILPIKRLLKAKLNNEVIDIKSLLYKPLFVPRNHQVMDLLNEFKSSRIHMAIVVDEYGGCEGIITMEDILEEIVGDIFDEQDKIEEQYKVIKEDKHFIVDGGMNIEDAFELIGISKEVETDYTTIGGFCQEILDRFAKTGDEFEFDNFLFKVIEAEKYTVEKLEIIKLKENDE